MMHESLLGLQSMGVSFRALIEPSGGFCKFCTDALLFMSSVKR